MAAAEHDSEKLRRKICKKSNRLRETLLKKENISAVDFPTLVCSFIFLLIYLTNLN
jgi:hypothetical protein